jgi:hypothetical protein
LALTELQLPAKEDFYNSVRSASRQMDRLMHTWGDLADGINRMGADDLDAMGIPAGQIRTDLIAFKTMLNELIAFYNGEGTTQTSIPANVIDSVRLVQ